MHIAADFSLNTALVSIVVGFGLGLGFALATGLISLLRRGRAA